ncbi:class I SAM-dependent methyltransferase [Hamadaea tsunoensis]|uniref:class I SAM-dependent methyltransferase n=1 Tax=Hamadaea tsunoensis TaxID=53368 RepID=UPI000428D5C9|nr:methyltransferase domain-containing protein [Hamadaea tsunoensis]
MTTNFGEVAALYDARRPGHPPEVAEQVFTYLGGTPDRAVEIGAGTGQATVLFAGNGFPITAVEPDDRMAAVLLDRGLPDVTVVSSTFEDWTPPAGGVPFLYAALVWHWLTPVRRTELAAAALAPGGVLAIIGARNVIEDEELDAEILRIMTEHPGGVLRRPPLFSWAPAELTESGLFTEPVLWTTRRSSTLDDQQFLDLQRTYGPYRSRPAGVQAEIDIELRDLVAGRGGSVAMRVDTHLILARRVDVD